MDTKDKARLAELKSKGHLDPDEKEELEKLEELERREMTGSST